MSSLRLRLLYSAGFILLLFIVLTGLAMDRALQRYAEDAEYNRLQGLLFSLLGATEVESADNVFCNTRQVPEPRLQRPDSGLIAVIYHEDGSVAWDSASLIDKAPNFDLPRTNEWQFQGADFFRLSYGFEWAIGEEDIGRFTLLVQDNKSSLQSQRKSFTRQMWWWLLGIGIALLLTLLALMHWGLVPLKMITQQLDEIRNGRQKQLAGKVPDEVQALTQSLNALLAHERNQQQRFRNALDDLAHSLKTPLAVLRNQTDDHNSQKLQTQLDRMDDIISYQLGRAATAGSSAFRPPVAVVPIIRRIIQALQKVYIEKNIRFEVQVPEALSLPIDEGDLMELLGNLLENAAKYGRQHVCVSVKAQPKTQLIIDDDGTGFPENAQQLLQRGFRADTQQPGQGIGLAVAQEIVQAYGAEISLEKSELGGGRVRLHFSQLEK